MRKALVTGGNGFIGSHLVDELVDGDWQVRVLDNRPPSASRNGCAPPGDVQFLEGDIRDVEVCQQACCSVDTVFHLAGSASVRESVADPRRIARLGRSFDRTAASGT